MLFKCVLFLFIYIVSGSNTKINNCLLILNVQYDITSDI